MSVRSCTPRSHAITHHRTLPTPPNTLPHTHHQTHSHTQGSLDVYTLALVQALESVRFSCLSRIFLLCDSTFLITICKMGTQMPPTRGDQGMQ